MNAQQAAARIAELEALLKEANDRIEELEQSHTWSEESRAKLSASMKEAMARRTPAEKEETARKISRSVRAAMAKRTPEQKAETSKKISATMQERNAIVRRYYDSINGFRDE